MADIYHPSTKIYSVVGANGVNGVDGVDGVDGVVCVPAFLKWRQPQAAVTVLGVSAQVFRYVHRVTYADCTLGNHIYYSRYLDLLEAARNEFFRQLGTTLLQLQEQDTIFPVVECHIRYKAPARYDEVLTIELWPELVQGARLNFGCRIVKEENVLVLEGETLHVCTGLNEKPKRVPEELTAKLKLP